MVSHISPKNSPGSTLKTMELNWNEVVYLFLTVIYKNNNNNKSHFCKVF